ncbi:MAG: polyprenyl synthetase family protein [Acidobacteria bacterium]|nr:polyprenyl synthetase family protein [Acidobacteriota bacterium]
MAAPNPLHVIPTMERDLQRVEEQLASSVLVTDPYLSEIAGHLIAAGGKRVRPGFAIAAASAANNSPIAATPEVISGAVSVELVHIGSLYHDDVMDDAEVRRTVDSVNARWGNLTAILAGDFLLARASELAASLGTEVAGLLASTIARLCEGQILELKDLFNVERSEELYLESVDGKTASLLATACRIGGIVAELERDQIETLTVFGHAYGMAFQIVDDILDIIATADQLGKPAGNDLIEGCYTLPVIRTLQSDQCTDLAHLLGEPLDTSTRDKVRDIVRAGPGIASALDDARRFANQASAAIEPLQGTQAHTALGTAAAHLLDQLHTVDTV